MFGLIDIGGTKVAVASATRDGLGAVQRMSTPQQDPEAALVDLLQGASGHNDLDYIGISAPGPFDRAGAALIDPPGMPESWRGLQLGRALGAHFNCPVLVENDANCAALAEARRGAGSGASAVVYFTVSTGIGSGVVREGRLMPTRSDTEGGHQVVWPEWTGGPPCHCGGHGCLETLASGLAIERRFGVRGEHLDDPEAWHDVGRWLGLGVVNAVALHDPDAVIFGGGVCASWARFAPSLFDAVRSHLFLQPLPRIERGTLGEERNLIGALELVHDHLQR